jgi:outer membrane protein
MIRFISAAIIALGVLLSGSVLAQSTAWSLQKCINHAFEHNIQIKQSALNNDRAEIGFLSAKGAFLPSLNASGSHGYNIGRSIDPLTNDFFPTDAIQSNSFGLNSGITLYNGFKNHLNLKRAALGIDIAAINLEQTKNDLALTISAAYLNVLFQEEFVTLANLNLETTKRQVNRVVKLVEAGAAPHSDLLDVQAQEAADYASLISNENSRSLAKLNLVQLLQLSSEQSATFEILRPSEDDLEVSTLPSSSAQAINHALNTFPEIRAAALSVDDAYLNLDIAKTNYLPRLFASYNFGSGYSGNRKQPVGDPTYDMVELGTTDDGQTVYYAGITEAMDIVIPLAPSYSEYQAIPFADQLSDNINQSIFFSLSIPIFNGFSSSNTVQQAEVGVLQSKYAQESTSQILTQSIESAWADAVAAQKNLLAQEAALASAELAFLNTELRFEAGAISALEYADSRTRLDNARTNSLRTRYDLVFKSKILDFYQGKTITLR